MTSLLLLAAAVLAAELPPLTVTARAPQPPEEPYHEEVNPCAMSRLDDDLLGKKKKGCKGITRVGFNPKLEAVAWGVNGKKMWVSEIKLQFSLSLEMSITKNFEVGSCVYNATLVHERGHWNDALDLQKASIAGFKADLAKLNLPTAAKPALVDEKKQQDFADAKSAVVLKAFEKRRDDYWAKLRAAFLKRDSPYRYRMVDMAKCPKDEWLNDAP